ncbi:ankyrin repeat domain-containing protein, partial [Wolbachia endosymbiont of Pentidionis agamae]|uniref:ankyrin repeat domain-containing protein n=1 Tax=Wolbachia endosymbiont of Pentidionis agamae TaxID=3110435 RepID=UPI002FD1F5F0
MKNNDAKTVRTLIDNGAELSAFDGNGYRAIHIASQNGSNDVIDLLLTSGVCGVNNESKKCDSLQPTETPLHVAIKYHRLSTVEFLISKNANVNRFNGQGLNAIHYAFDAFKHCCGKEKSADRECGLITQLSKCDAISKIFTQQSTHFNENCVWFAVAEFLIRRKAEQSRSTN